MTKEEMVEKVASMIRLRRSSPFEMLTALDRQRTVWIEENIPTYLQSEVWNRAIDLIAETDKLEIAQ